MAECADQLIEQSEYGFRYFRPLTHKQCKRKLYDFLKQFDKSGISVMIEVVNNSNLFRFSKTAHPIESYDHFYANLFLQGPYQIFPTGKLHCVYSNYPN